MYTNSSGLMVISKVLVLLLFGLGLTFASSASANQSSGWFAPKVDYVSDSISCPDNQASVEIWLVEKNSQTLLSDSIDNWTVNVRKSNSDQTIVSSKNINGQKTSGALCFDPAQNGLQVVVFSSSNYKTFISPTVYPGSANSGMLSSMQGSHFRGYVQLEKSSESASSVESVAPNGEGYDVMPSFFVKTNSLTSLYNVNEVETTKLYVINQSTNQLYTRTIPMSGGTGTRELPGPTGVPDGHYFWTFHQELNGEAETTKNSNPITVWNFTSTPYSGVPDLIPFTKDTTPPSISLHSFLVVQSTATTSTIEFIRDATDPHAGLSYSTLVIVDKVNGSDVLRQTTNYSNNITSSTTVFTLAGLDRGKEYTFYTENADNFGNLSSSTPVDFFVPTSSVPPTVTFLEYSHSETHSQAYVYGSVTDKNTNPLTVQRVGTCWATSTASLDTSDIFNTANCTDTVTPANFQTTTAFTFFIQNLPSSSTVYYRMLAQNEAGWGYSAVDSFGTKVSPYANAGVASTTPTVSYIAPTSVFPTSLNPNLSITNAGNLPITEYGVCYALNYNDINDLDPSNFSDPVYYSAWSSRCKLYGALSQSTPLPYKVPFATLYTFTNLSPNQMHYFKVFAINEQGVGSSIGSIQTDELWYHFTNYYSEPLLTYSEDDYNEVTNTYDKITITIAAYDKSFDATNGRTINYKLTLDVLNDSITPNDTKTGTTVAVRVGSSPAPNAWGGIRNIEFYDVPATVPITVTSNINEPTSTYPQQASSADKVVSVDFTLPNPNITVEVVTGEDDGSGYTLEDPEINLSSATNIIRPGQSTNLSWEVKNTDIDCELSGSSNFTTLYFNPLVDEYGTLDIATDVRSGTVSTGAVNNTQLYEFICTNSSAGVSFSTTTRVTVVGTPLEL